MKDLKLLGIQSTYRMRTRVILGEKLKLGTRGDIKLSKDDI